MSQIMQFYDIGTFNRDGMSTLSQMVELGVIDPFMDLWAESYDDSSRENVWGWLQVYK